MLFCKGNSINSSVFLTLFLSFFVGCSVDQGAKEEAYPVSWYAGFTMPDLLAGDVAVERRDEVSALLGKKWYASIDVINTRSEDESTFSSCEEYLREATPETRALREYEMNAFVELVVMCRATELLSTAENPGTSYIPEDVLAVSSPDRFPSELAFETSRTESEKNRGDPEVRYWGDINNIDRVDILSATVVDFYTDSGVQRVELVARGDFNGDGVEDIILTSRDSVDGGSYQHLRLFVLSVNAKGGWRTIKRYP